jgi:hypothetical protein
MANHPGSQWSSRSRNTYQISSVQIAGNNSDEMFEMFRSQHRLEQQSYWYTSSKFGPLVQFGTERSTINDNIQTI